MSAVSNIAKLLPLHMGSFEGGPQAVEHAAAHASGVALAGFGASQRAEASGAGQPAPPRATGTFGSVEADAPRHAPKQAVAATQFDAVVVTAPSSKPPSASGGVKTALEILQKPVPAYTSEARLRKLEGEVLLEALFSATGQVRVLRVLRGLGYGLDENAIQAAANIRFRPATERSQPVDTVAVVRIGFQLAY
jgi:TonB family protein